MKIDVRNDGLNVFLTVTRRCAECDSLHVIERDISNESGRSAFLFSNYRFDIPGCFLCRPGAWGEQISGEPGRPAIPNPPNAEPDGRDRLALTAAGLREAERRATAATRRKPEWNGIDDDDEQVETGAIIGDEV